MKLIGYMIMGVVGGPVLLVAFAYLISHPLAILAVIAPFILFALYVYSICQEDARGWEQARAEREADRNRLADLKALQHAYRRPGEIETPDPCRPLNPAKHRQNRPAAKWAADPLIANSPFYRGPGRLTANRRPYSAGPRGKPEQQDG